MHEVNQRNKVVVAGAGLMGTGIAHGFAIAGYPTVLFDIAPAALKRAQDSIAKILDDGVRLGKLDADKADATFKRLTPSSDLKEAAGGAALFLETVSESLDIKQTVIKSAEPELASGAIIATNTSALSVTQIATAAADPAKVIGMHFFNPVHKMKLVEIIRGLQTDDETLEHIRTYSDNMGKTSIVVNEAPGFATSRMSAMLGNEAMTMLQEGTATAEDIDTAMRLGFNHPMGPLELGDLTGWDTRLSVLKYLHATLGEKFRPNPLVIKMVAAGRFGRKTGQGVYKYEDGKKVPGSGLRASTL